MVGNIETNTRVQHVGQQLANHNCRAQFIHPGFLVVAQNKRAASGGHQTEYGESVYDEAQLLVWQQRVDEDEAHRREQEQPHPSIKEAEGDEEQCAAQGSGHRGVEIPEERGGLSPVGTLVENSVVPQNLSLRP